MVEQKKSTLEVESGLLSDIKLYCYTFKIPQKDFLSIILKRDEHFSKVQKNIIRFRNKFPES